MSVELTKDQRKETIYIWNSILTYKEGNPDEAFKLLVRTIYGAIQAHPDDKIRAWMEKYALMAVTGGESLKKKNIS